MRVEGRERLYRLNGQALKPIHDWVKNHERSWSERFYRLGGVLEEMEQEDMDRQQHFDLGAIARSIIDANFYMTLGTADENGRPWVSPVYYAHQGYANFYWVSSPEATHSRNLVGRPEVSIVIFDSRTPVGSGQGVYISAVAEELVGADLDRGIAVFSGRSDAHGAGEWHVEDVRPPARHRLYRATASEHWVLGPQDRRMPVSV